jgi:ABC-2 type transport system permease protein
LRKLFALYTNEMIKTYRKASVIIILSIMIVGVIGIGGLMKFQETINTRRTQNSQNDTTFQKQNNQNNIDSQKKEISAIEDKMKTATGADLANLELQKENMQSQIDKLQYASDHGIMIGSPGYLSEAFDKLYSYQDSLNGLKAIPSEMLNATQKSQKTTMEGYISRLQKVLDNKDFKEYISVLNDEINSSDKTADEKKIYLDSNALRLKANLTGLIDTATNTYDNSLQMLSQIENNKLSLLYNIDYSNIMKPLTQENRDKIKNDIAVSTYKLEHRINTVTSNSGTNIKDMAMSGMTGFGLFALVILMMILAGGSVSQEMSTGSIKSLIISPTKRWKIFVAKLASLLTVGIIGAFLLYLISNIFFGIYYGYSSGSSYIYASNGVAHELNFYVLNLAKLFVNFAEVLVYLALALMLSVITRNTAAAVGISIAVYFGGSLASQFLLFFAKGEWLNFVPFYNLDFASKLFPNDSITAAMNGGIGNTVKTSLTFSFCYVVVILICMLYTALDSFNRRDIK